MKKHGQMSIVLFLSVVVLSGCATLLNGYGTNVLDETAWNSFENFQIDRDMNYYASGPQDPFPIVIMGLKKQYILEPLAKRGMICFHQKDKVTDCKY